MFNNMLVEVLSCKADIIWITQITYKRVNIFYLSLWLGNDISQMSKRHQHIFNMFLQNLLLQFFNIKDFFVNAKESNVCLDLNIS